MLESQIKKKLLGAKTGSPKRLENLNKIGFFLIERLENLNKIVYF
jgi:hypothetical protein